MSGQIDVTLAFSGKRVLFIGATGFVGKVALSLLLRRYPCIGKVYTLVRPGSGMTATERFFGKIAASRPFDPVKEAFGDGYLDFLREKVVPVGGDVSQPQIGLSEGELAQLTAQPPDLIINCAGLVSFNPSLESALRINVTGVKNAVALAEQFGAALVHVSTCFVAGNRDGDIWEDEPLVGYFPRREGVFRPHGFQTTAAKSELRDDDFTVETEIADCERLIAQTRQRAEDRAHVSMFRDRGAARLRKEGRDADEERHLKAAVQRERKMWMSERLTELGMERAQHWGWPNTYTYTKSLGDQLCAQAAQRGLRVSIVRPAIVESSVSYPFPGWNEGFNTTAPLVFMALKGHLQIPAGKDTILDVIPVDMVASGLLAAAAATLISQHKLVYHLGSSDSNPFRMARSVELTGLYRRRYYRARRDEKILNRVRARMECVPVSRDRYERASLPLLRELGQRASTIIEKNKPSWGMPRIAAFLDRAQEKLADITQMSKQGEAIFDLFMPFVYDNAIVFRCDHTRDLFARLAPQDQAALVWAPDGINWREYFLYTHLPGLEKWIFPSLDEEFQARPKSVYTYRDLLELFNAATKHYRGRTAMRLLPPKSEGGKAQDEGRRYTYKDLGESATKVALSLGRTGVQPGNRVLLVSENRPEWGMTYFGILRAGATCVPVDSAASLDEIRNIAKSGKVAALVASDKVLERLGPDLTLADLGEGQRPQLLRFSDLLVPTLPGETLRVLPVAGRAEEVASLIFTSGTTGRPKGVMLSHRNFTSLLSKMGAVFDLDKHDGLLSVLPLHHTFEFSAGLLMPLSRGAQISYLSETSPESLQAAFRSSLVTGMIGVPALFQLFYRRITKQITEGPLPESARPWALRIFTALLSGMQSIRKALLSSLGSDINPARFLFFPVHRRFGGRLRLLISGGSALPVEIMKALSGLGFHLYEGYGLTEAAPVLTVSRPGKPLLLGSVGEPLTGIDVKIFEPDERGVGEIIASGPNVMLGYFEDKEATQEVLQKGYLHTGDLGRFDEEGRLYIVGRKKDVIIGMNGENVYPDELEEHYRQSPYIKELSVVGLPSEGESTDEVVSALVVPAYEGHGEALSREAVRERVRAHLRKEAAKLPLHKRLKIVHLTDQDLPKTATRKVKRKQVVEELRRLERVHRQASALRHSEKSGDTWLYDLLAKVTDRKREDVVPEASLQSLGLDSLTFAELGVALEAAGIAIPENADLSSIGTVAELAQRVATFGHVRGARPVQSKTSTKKEPEGDRDRLHIPEPLRKLGDEGLNFGQRMLYERLFTTRVVGKAHLPSAKSFIVAANHASHLDMGLVKHALGEWGPRLVAMAAKDYFFDDPLRRAYFENFTSLVPMDRHGSIRESLRLAHEVIRSGHILLIFPEGTRSEDGIMKEFKASIGHLALHNHIDVLPMYLEGTHDAMPKGAWLPQKREITAYIGPLISHQALRKQVERLPKNEQNRKAAHIVELAVRRLAQKKENP